MNDEAMKIFDEAVKSGSETRMIRAYRAVDSSGNEMLSVDFVEAMPCTNGSSTCMDLPPVTNKKDLVFEWHPHPSGTSLPSGADLSTSLDHGAPGLIWYNDNGSPKPRFYQGVKR